MSLYRGKAADHPHYFLVRGNSQLFSFGIGVIRNVAARAVNTQVNASGFAGMQSQQGSVALLDYLGRDYEVISQLLVKVPVEQIVLGGVGFSSGPHQGEFLPTHFPDRCRKNVAEGAVAL